MINWKVRIKNKNFWLSIVPATILLVQVVGGLFNITLDLNQTSDKLLNLINTVFMVLAILGIVQDPTTQGVGDSLNALHYTVPKPKGE